jgi:hypothetical protein
MTSFLEKHSQNAILAAVLTSILAIVTSLGSVFFTYYFTTASQDRQLKIEQVSKFDGTSAQLIDAAGLFIDAINAKQDLATARLKVRTVVATQIQDTETLRKIFDGKIEALINDYQSALEEFNQVAEKTASVTEMRPWAESFGRVLDTKSTLSHGLSNAIGIVSKGKGALIQGQLAPT